LALKMIHELCGDDDLKWNQATEASKAALKQRNSLWNSLLEYSA